MSKRFTYEPGREIHLDGKPFLSIQREGVTSPAAVDYVARLLTRFLNLIAFEDPKWLIMEMVKREEGGK